MVRLRSRSGKAVVSPGGSGPGRSAYIHPEASCLQRARKTRAVERALGATCDESLGEELERGLR